MEDPIGVLHPGVEGREALQVAGDELHPARLESLGLGGGADERGDLIAPGQEPVDDVAADKTGGAGKKDPHPGYRTQVRGARCEVRVVSRRGH